MESITSNTHHKYLKTLNELAETLLTAPPEEFIKKLPQKTCELFSVSICILWEKNKEKQKFIVADASMGVDEDYKKLELDTNFAIIQKYYDDQGIYYLPDVEKASDHFLHLKEVKERGWVSMLSIPLRREKEIIGILDIFTENPRHFSELDKEQFKCFSNFAALSFEKAKFSQKEAENIADREKLQKLTEIMLDMLNYNNAEDIFKSLLNGALELVTVGDKVLRVSDGLVGEITRLNYSTGDLEIIQSNKQTAISPPLRLGDGITGLALRDLRTINVNDVVNDKTWREIYVNFWEKTRSEIAVPIFIDKIPVIEKTSIKKTGCKLIGVLNIESPEIKAFSEADEKYLKLLALYAAVLIDRRESDKKVTRLRQQEQQIAGYQNFNQIMESVLESITQILEFDVVNISLINFATKRIKTEYIGGIPDEQKEEFKKDADHSLDSNDIQASIVRNKSIEVPSVDEPRFDPRVFNKYGHENLIRVFIPMIEPSTDRVIGTLEAGYNRQYRKYIYERDVQILESFVDYVVQALEHKKSEIMDKITHEFRTPIVGIRSNASFLQRRIQELHPGLIDKKLEDILTDCEILSSQVAELEYLMGNRLPPSYKIQRTRVFTDVILKTIRQLSPIVIEHGFSLEAIDYSTVKDSVRTLTIKTDKIRLNQVIYNLFMNSIKNMPKMIPVSLESRSS